MSFRGYKLEFDLNALHRSNHTDEKTSHLHTFRIRLFLEDMNEIMDLYHDVEGVVNEKLNQYRNCDLDETDAFHRDTTVEGIGEVLFDILKETVESLGFRLVRLEIGDSPTRCYSVSDELLDESVNAITRMPYLKVDEMGNQDSDTPEHAEVSKEDTMVEDTDTLEQSATPEADMTSDVNDGDGCSNNTVSQTVSELTKKKFPWAELVISVLFLMAAAAVIVWMIAESGVYPRGSDTFNHLFRGKLVYDGIREGNFYLLYSEKWYNGIELMRYWSPLPLYLIAGCIALAGGDMMNGYLVLIAAIILIGGIGWLLVGIRMRRVFLGAVIGIIWFLLPDNMRILFNEGNIPRIVVGILLPYLLLCIYEFTEKEKWKYIFPTAILTGMMALCHLMIAAMVGLTVFVYVCIHAIVTKKIVPQILLLIGMVLSFALVGVWLYAALQGGFMEMNAQGTAQVMKDFFANGFASLNPLMRYSGDQAVFYFGIAMFLVALAGCFFGRKEVLPGFITVLFLYFSTTDSMYELYSRLPFHQFFWMIRFIPVGLAVALFSFLLWKGLKKWVLLLLCSLLIVDALSSLWYLYVPKDNRIENVVSEQYERAERFGILQAKARTKQRMAIYDLSGYGAYAAYMVSGVEPEKNYSFGWAWQGAQTAANLVSLNDAYTEGYYNYLFDRSLELGNDVILMKKDLLDIDLRPSTRGFLQKGAELSGYELVEEGEEYMIFQLNQAYDTFGVVTTYQGIAIGSSARDIAKVYPGLEEAENGNLDDYEAVDLADYQTVYLSGFTYSDKNHMEKLLKELNQMGVHVVINMNHIPEEDSVVGNQILGVTAHAITFTGAFPFLDYKGEVYNTAGFGEADGRWSTVYLNGLDTVTGYGTLEGQELPFAGTLTAYPNITFMGYNLAYHELVTKDAQVGNILDDLFEMNRNDVPRRDIYPLEIEVSPYEIKISSQANHVNTTLACYDIFRSDDILVKKNHLLYVNEGETTIRIVPPYLAEGILLSLVGGVLFTIYGRISYRMMKKRKDQSRKGA